MKRIAWCLAFAVGLAAARPLAAGTYHWTGAVDGFWTNANNWAEGKVPGRYETPDGRMGAAGDTVVFGDALKGKAATTIDFDGDSTERDPGVGLPARGGGPLRTDRL